MTGSRKPIFTAHRLSIATVAIIWLMISASNTRADDIGIDPARVAAITPMLTAKPTGVGKPIADRAAWASVASQPYFQGVLTNAERMLKEKLPQTNDHLFLEFSTNGNRQRWETINFRRRARINTLVLAECIENKGRFLPPLNEVLKSLCAEKTWVLSAHDVGLTNFNSKLITIDLGSSNLAWMMATADWLLGDRLDPTVRQLVRDKIKERIFDPYMGMTTGKRQADHWITVRGNHNSVTLSGVTGAALALIEKPEDRAFYIAAAEKYSENYLDGFAPDGYCSEGIGYWNYGFGHFLMLGETILQATGGKIDLLAGEKVIQPSLFGTKIEIVPGICPAYSDCDVDSQVSPTYMAYINRKWQLGIHRFEHAELTEPADPWESRLFEVALFAFPNTASRMPEPAHEWTGPGERTWFEYGGVLNSRPGEHESCRLAVSLKGGHNGEQHNHNDVGSYVVVVGGQLVLVDPGPEFYTKRTFSDHRYDSNLINSFGHSVPVVAGQLQRTGARARGKVVRTEFTDDADTLTLDMTSAYDVVELDKLERTFVYSRAGQGSLTVTDDFTFTKPETFATAMITFGEWKQVAPDRLRITDGKESLDVVMHARGGKFRVKATEIHEDATAKRTPIHIGVEFTKPVATGQITLSITPARG